MRLMPSGTVRRTFGWGLGLAVVGLPFPESILGFHALLQQRFGIAPVISFLVAYIVSLMQMFGECIIFDIAGQRVSKRLGSWWAHSWIRQEIRDFGTFVAEDVSLLLPVIRPFVVASTYLLLFGLSANPIPIPIPGNPLGRGGAIALWRSLGLRRGGWVIVLGTLVRLGLITCGIRAVVAR